jgi:hypothetical protein
MEQSRRNHGKDTYLRLLAAQHITTYSFREHKRPEGMREDASRPEFLNSDRLLALETIYGKVQMGYDPARGESFLLASIKPSIHDAAPSSYQREYNEGNRARQLKAGTQNIAFTSRRRSGSVVHLYKREDKPWGFSSVAPYLGRANMDALHKAMPFLDSREERVSLAESRLEKRGQEARLRELMAAGKYGEMAAIRRKEHETLLAEDFWGALVRRKKSMLTQFFRRLNGAYEGQKQEMFIYYRERIRGGRGELRESDDTPARKEDEDE